MIPPNLLHAVSVPGGGLLSLVIGAGCSVPLPTDIPRAAELASSAHQKLVHDGVLGEGECEDPTNLAALTSLVFAKTGSQEELVRRLPINRMRIARANDGYKVLAALMAERAISHVLSLNFDLAVENAAAELGIEIHVIATSGAPIPIRAALVHLHGSVNGSSEELVLRQETIDNGWKASWHQVVAQQILAAPNVLFAGLGSAAPVLSQTVELIRDAVGNQKAFFQTDIGTHATNHFAHQLNVAENRYIQGDWCDVMKRLSARLVQGQVDSLLSTGAGVLEGNGASANEIDDFRATVATLRDVPLLALGKFRAHIRVSRTARYVPVSTPDEELMAIPVCTLAAICKKTGLTSIPGGNGLWLLKRNGKTRATVLVASGGGSRKAGALESPIKSLCNEIAEACAAGPDIVLLGGLVPDALPMNGAAPLDIVEGDEVEDLISGPRDPLTLVAESADSITRMEEWLNAG